MVPLGRGIRGKIGELEVITDYRRLANALGLAAPQREGGVRGGLRVGKLESFRVSPLDYSCLILIVTPPLRLTQQLTYMLPDAYYAHWVCTVGLPADCACGLAFSDEHLHEAQKLRILSSSHQPQAAGCCCFCERTAATHRVPFPCPHQ